MYKRFGTNTQSKSQTIQTERLSSYVPPTISTTTGGKTNINVAIQRITQHRAFTGCTQRHPDPVNMAHRRPWPSGASRTLFLYRLVVPKHMSKHANMNCISRRIISHVRSDIQQIHTYNNGTIRRCGNGYGHIGELTMAKLEDMSGRKEVLLVLAVGERQSHHHQEL